MRRNQKPYLLLLTLALVFTHTYSQEKSERLYLFGKEYAIDTLGIEYELRTKTETARFTRQLLSEYSFCGVNRYIIYERSDRDSLDNAITKSESVPTDCIDFESLLDSLQLASLDLNDQFSIRSGWEEFSIIGFSVMGDSSAATYSFTGSNFSEPYETDRTAAFYLRRILGELKTSRKLMLYNIRYYSSRRGRVMLDGCLLLRK